MPRVVDPDFVWIDDVEKEVKENGYLSLFYHTETYLIVIGARDSEEAVDCIEEYLNFEWGEEYEYFSDIYFREIKSELRNLTGKDDEVKLERMWEDDNELRERIYNKYKEDFRQTLNIEIEQGLPSELKNIVEIDLEEAYKYEQEYKKVASNNFERAKKVYFVKSKVHEYLKKKGFSVTSEVLDGEGLNKIIKEILDEAINETAAQNRETIEIEDFKVSKDFPFVPYDPLKSNSLYVKSKVFEYIEGKGYTPSSDVLNGGILNKIISDILDKAVVKAKMDNRSIVGQMDFE